MIAQQTPNVEEEEAFLTGILHDLGITVVFVNMPREFRKILELADSEQVDYREAEASFWPYTHDLIGAEVLRRWELPEQVPEAVAVHHSYSAQDNHPVLAAVLYLADRVALAPETDEVPENHFAEAASNTEQLFELTAERVADWLVEITEEGREEAEALMSILS